MATKFTDTNVLLLSSSKIPAETALGVKGYTTTPSIYATLSTNIPVQIYGQRDISFMDRYYRYSQGTVLSADIAFPEIGNVYKTSVTPTALSARMPVISAGGLQAAPGTLIYLGGDLKEDFRSLTLEVEWKDGTPQGGVVGLPVITIAVGDQSIIVPNPTTGGYGIDIRPGMLHYNLSTGGIVGASWSLSGGSNFGPMSCVNAASLGVPASGISGIYPWNPSTVSGLPLNVRHIITFETCGDEVRVTAAGTQYIFKGQFNNGIGQVTPTTRGGKSWWIEFGGHTSTTTVAYPRFHRVTVNGEEYEARIGATLSPKSQIFTDFLTTGAVTIPNSINVEGGVTFASVLALSGSPTGTVNSPGNYFSYKQYGTQIPGFGTFAQVMNTGWQTSPISAVSGVQANLLNIDGIPLNAKADGAWTETIALFNFPNTNPKRIGMKFQGSPIFETDEFTSQGVGRLSVYRNKNNLGNMQLTMIFDTDNYKKSAFFGSANFSGATTTIMYSASAHNDVICRNIIGKMGVRYEP